MLIHFDLIAKRRVISNYISTFYIFSGETGHNKERVIQGQLDIPLSINGVNQAKLLGKNLNGATWKEVCTHTK